MPVAIAQKQQQKLMFGLRASGIRVESKLSGFAGRPICAGL
jgi:hypothetical protein